MPLYEPSQGLGVHSKASCHPPERHPRIQQVKRLCSLLNCELLACLQLNPFLLNQSLDRSPRRPQGMGDFANRHPRLLE